MPFWINLLAGLISFAIAGSFGLILIPYLRKLKAGSHILDIGPAWHKSKEGTPLMGGFMFILSVPIAAWVAYICIKMYRTANMIEAPEKAGLKLLLAIAVSMLFMLIGFADDYIKVVKKRNLGFSIKAKTILQVVLICVYLAALHFLGYTTEVVFPLIGTVDFGWLYYPIMGIAIYGVVNAVNFTDGVDGLLGSVTVVYAAAFTMIFVILDNWEMSALSMGDCRRLSGISYLEPPSRKGLYGRHRLDVFGRNGGGTRNRQRARAAYTSCRNNIYSRAFKRRYPDFKL